MRIIGGKYGGLRLNIKLPDGVRPTTDYSKEMIFNILNHHFDFNNKTILDLCAGSGNLGIEAISRGALHCTFVEKNTKVAEVLKNTIEKVRISSTEFNIIKQDVVKFLDKNNTTFDALFTDPPYNLKLINNILSYCSGNLLSTGGIFVAEFGQFEDVLIPQNFETIANKTLGETRVLILKKNG